MVLSPTLLQLTCFTVAQIVLCPRTCSCQHHQVQHWSSSSLRLRPHRGPNPSWAVASEQSYSRSRLKGKPALRFKQHFDRRDKSRRERPMDWSRPRPARAILFRHAINPTIPGPVGPVLVNRIARSLGFFSLDPFCSAAMFVFPPMLPATQTNASASDVFTAGHSRTASLKRPIPLIETTPSVWYYSLAALLSALRVSNKDPDRLFGRTTLKISVTNSRLLRLRIGCYPCLKNLAAAGFLGWPMHA
ncbi:hypothetical protein CPLU01_05875 [Colletotrichum plurivorum]|uniref:Secreted protein n=1 Tax=Colletotrichum plurivorum TaxID=2175906 RepID=A0A8H6KKU8_9PEZI|nr:hypothetical protein CPLU01_05875 [Colletotrichum plurivorum]